MANTSLQADIYTYLHAYSAFNALVSRCEWGPMPVTAVDSTRVTYSMLSDVRVYESHARAQRWRFWICVPAATANGKTAALTIGNKLLDLLHEVQGTFGSTYILWSENVSNHDPEFDENSASWMVIQDYIIKTKSLNI